MADWFDNVPVPMDANGCVVPLDIKELVHKGETRKVYGFIYGTRPRHWFVEFEEFDGISLSSCTMPDSWESLEEDALKTPREYVEKRGINTEISDDERREVAENLRHLTIGNHIRYNEQFFYDLAGVVVGFEDFPDFNVVLEKLADLIDPEGKDDD